MASYSSAAAQRQPEPERGVFVTPPPLVSTIIFSGARTPPRAPGLILSGRDPLAEKFAKFDEKAFVNKAAETAAAREIAAYVLRLEVERQYERELAPLRDEVASLRERIVRNERQMSQLPTINMDRYVDVASIALAGGKLASVVAVLAILVYLLTGFAMVHPLIAGFVLISGIAFYCMGRMTQARYAQAK